MPIAGPEDWLVGGGEMAKAIKAIDWSKTPLGPMASWPQSLRTTVSLVQASDSPISLVWGTGHVQIYNDGYWPICGAKHPTSMGQDFRECWASAWPVIGEAYASAWSGKSGYLEKMRMFLDRYGFLEETWFTFSFSPVTDESGSIGGLFHPVTEMTSQMLSERRTKTLRDLASHAGRARTAEDAFAVAAQILAESDLDLPFVLFYLLDGERNQARLVGQTGLRPGTRLSPALMDLRAPSSQPWPIGEIARAGESQQIDGVASLLASMTVGPYPELPKTAFALPIMQPGSEKPAAVMVAGVSSRLTMNEPYRGFYDLVAASVSTALANARAYEAEREKAEALAEIDRAKTAFFSNVSHEFRTPLTLMLGPTEDALSSPGQALSGEPLQMVHRNALRLMRLVNALLDFSRIESGRMQAAYQPSDLAAMTTHLASAFRSAIERTGLTFEVECESLPEPVYVDGDMWEKIVLNLLSNALKFTFEGSIGVAVRWRGDHAELQVQDTGTGIPASELPQLFERFHQVRGARSRTHEGSGIGLALVHDLVKLHGGTVEVASRPGAGTTFTVSIPRGSAHLPPEHVVASRPAAWTAKGATPFVEEALRWSGASTADGAGPFATAPSPNTAVAGVRILVVDDNADLRDYIVNLLREHYLVETAVDGLAALDVARVRKPTLVLSDVMMPHLDGFGLLRALRADPALRDVPVILLSARAGEESTLEGLEAGADDYLVKPFAARELLARVRTHVEASLLRARLLFLEAAPDPLVIIDPVGCISLVNGQTERVFGYPRARLIGKPVEMLMADRFRDRLLPHRMEFAARRQESFTASLLDLCGVRSDGSEFPIEISLSPVHTDEGTVISAAFRDVTERKRLDQANRQASELEAQNRRIQEASRMKSEFLANMSHELRTPLNAILGFGQMLHDGMVPPDSPQHDEFLGDIIKSGQHLLQLINDVLDLAKIEAGKLSFRPEEIDLEILIGEVLSIVSAVSVAKSVRMEASIAPELKSGIFLDPARLKQVLYNFISNALKFTSAGGVVAVRARPHGEECLLLEVEDAGPGIAPEDIARLFVEFQQLEAGSAKEHSTGLGLAMTRRLAEAQGGSAGVRSALGKGSVFHVILPRQSPRRP